MKYTRMYNTHHNFKHRDKCNSAHDSSESQEKRAPLCTFVKGSLTLEASLAIPIFLIAVVCIIYLIELMAIQATIRSGLHEATKELSKAMITEVFISPNRVEEEVIDAIGRERLDRSVVVNGAAGIDASKSKVSKLNGKINIDVTYAIELPFPQFASPSLRYEESLFAKGFTGYVKGGLEKDGELVYLTEAATVYHKDYNCTHLQLSIESVDKGSVEGARNDYGGKYYACERCGRRRGTGILYVTATGDRYHKSLSCSGLKRTIRSVPLEEVIGKGVCQRCGSG